ncbi:DNA-J related domain-containing protein [Hahella ganghwensis]|uniref:DNA-J related domain-containing protein n=1 Tax=Hahella ganghwensis TaxID=286420 RepID=UPI00146139B2|nr:DNA-J related domain-containing protein [Hahella ganghwensis]
MADSDSLFEEAWEILIGRLSKALETILVEQALSMSEYELIKKLSDEPYCIFDEQALSDQLNLFQTHFVLFHALYLLRESRWKNHGTWIEISPLSIAASSSPQASDNAARLQVVGKADPLQSYYLDLSNLTDTSRSDVDKLLNNFWEAYLNPSQRQSALKILDCESDADWPTIKGQYRKLAMEHHPDRGGNSQTFTAIREAYEILKLYRKQ